jgi:hypothetical protein
VGYVIDVVGDPLLVPLAPVVPGVLWQQPSHGWSPSLWTPIRWSHSIESGSGCPIPCGHTRSMRLCRSVRITRVQVFM